MSLDDHFNINYKATRFVTLAALKHMTAGSSIVNVTSICSESKQAHEGGPYSDSKAAATSFTYGLTRDLALKGIRINIVAPGLTDTLTLQIYHRQIARLLSTKCHLPMISYNQNMSLAPSMMCVVGNK